MTPRFLANGFVNGVRLPRSVNMFFGFGGFKDDYFCFVIVYLEEIISHPDIDLIVTL